MTEVNYRRVLATKDLPDGKMTSVELCGKSILICHVQGVLYAVDNICTHAFAKMSEGRLRGTRVICPLHGATFDCRTGAVLSAPAISPLSAYPVRKTGDDIEVAV